MAGPWDKYKKAPVSTSASTATGSGPWSKYQTAPKVKDESGRLPIDQDPIKKDVGIGNFINPDVDLSGNTVLPARLDSGYEEDGSIDVNSPRWEGMTAQEILDQMELDKNPRLKSDDSMERHEARSRQIGEKALSQSPEFEGIRSMEADSEGSRMAAEAGVKAIKDEIRSLPELRDLDEESLDKIANTAYTKGAAKTAAAVATWPIQGRNVLTTVGKMGLAGAGVEGAGQAAIDEDWDYDEMLEEGLKAGALGGALKSVEKLFSFNPSVQELNELGKKANKQLEKFEKVGKYPQLYLDKEVSPGITVLDVRKAREEVSLAKELSDQGGKVGTQKVAEKLKKADTLQKVLSDARAPLEKASGLSSKVLGKDVTQAIGLRQGGIEQARKSSVNKVSDSSIAELDKLKVKGRDFRNEVISDVQEVFSHVKKGDFEKADELADVVRDKLKGISGNLSNKDDIAFSDKLFSYNRKAQSLRRLGKEAEAPTKDTALAIALPALFAVTGDLATGGMSLAARGATARAVTKTTRNRLDLVEKALKGKLDKQTKKARVLEKGIPASRVVTTDYDD